MIIIKNPDELERMRVSGRIAAEVRDRVARKIAPGVTTGDLGDYAGQLIKENSAESAFLGYRGYPGQICVSVNDEVVHGIPGKRRIAIGDVVSIDVGVRFDGFLGDTATTVMVGVTDPAVVKLVETAERALKNGIAEVIDGKKLSNVSNRIERTACSAGFSVVKAYVGHGIGRNLHEDPQIPNFGAPGRGPVMRKGMTLCLEPMINIGGSEVALGDDGWTVVTADGSYSAHFEHMVAVSDGVAEILTVSHTGI